MTEFGAIKRGVLAGAALSLLAACSGLNLGTADALQSVDVFNDDISQMSFAIDVPHILLPQDGGMVYKMDATTRELGARHIEAILVRGDDILAFTGLGPPANNRTYHLFAFSENDKINLREFQNWLKNIKATTDDAGGELSMAMALQFCRVTDVDVSHARVTVYVSLPGQTKLNPLFSNVKLTELGAHQADNLPICVQT